MLPHSQLQGIGLLLAAGAGASFLTLNKNTLMPFGAETSALSFLIRRSPSHLLPRDGGDTLNPLTVDLDNNDPNAIFAAYTPPPLPADTVSSLQAVSQESINNVNAGVVPDGSGGAGTTPDPDSNTYTQIPDLGGKYLLNAGSDGNFHLASAGSSAGGLQFVYDSGIVGADDQNRMMFYYPETMKKYGVSRFRVNDPAHIPKGTQVITLVSAQLNDADAHPTFLAADTSGNVFSLLTCVYSDASEPSKVFLASKPYDGASQLKDPSMQSIVTGAPIDNCGYVQFVDINAAKAAAT